jgi:hypothetical protein
VLIQKLMLLLFSWLFFFLLQVERWWVSCPKIQGIRMSRQLPNGLILQPIIIQNWYLFTVIAVCSKHGTTRKTLKFFFVHANSHFFLSLLNHIGRHSGWVGNVLPFRFMVPEDQDTNLGANKLICPFRDPNLSRRWCWWEAENPVQYQSSMAAWTTLEEDNIAFLLPAPKCSNCIKQVLMLELSNTDS